MSLSDVLCFYIPRTHSCISYYLCPLHTYISSTKGLGFRALIIYILLPLFLPFSFSCTDDDLCTDTRPALRDRRCIALYRLCVFLFSFLFVSYFLQTTTWAVLRDTGPPQHVRSSLLSPPPPQLIFYL
ncbi:uncharacterized protein BDW43DRAFT_92077 [Aspergillus alliaceus]|uniref:uncharacterized protein n=1 Tax=Petromyces alliaceus TaxID=209559 RepID=UPI0012A4E265|nr:uncharacterized protein BDW43DRAFT_92077 [Aspergillus alliaceus]KAB8233012.1 hypothetical protein BDW43DRAFT_92077 [Aspergillus alliaceus]